MTHDDIVSMGKVALRHIRISAIRAGAWIPDADGQLWQINGGGEHIRELTIEHDPRLDDITAALHDAERHLRDYQTAMARVTLLAAEMEAGT